MHKNVILLSVLILFSTNSNSHSLNIDALFDKVEKIYTLEVIPSQYMRSSSCKPTSTVFDGWKKYPVEECIYTSHQMNIDVTTKAYLLLPDAKKLAKWTVNACIDAKSKDIELCALNLSNKVKEQSAAQFPVAGFVVEPPMGKWKHPDQPYCYLFRDGVTVTTKSWPETVMHINNACGSDSVNNEPIIKAMVYGRVSGVTRSEYRNAGGSIDVGENDSYSPNFAKVVGEEFRKAWDSDRNYLFYATALSTK